MTRKRAGSSKQEITELPLGDRPDNDWLAAAGFLAVLAFPDDYKRRDAFVLCAKAYVIKGAIKAKRVSKRAIRTEFRQFPERKIWDKGPMPLAARIITRHRLPAAQAATGVMNHAAWRNLRFQVELAHGGVPLSSVNRASVAFGADGARDTNWIHRVWSPSQPVLHLALALQSVLCEIPGQDLWSLIDTPTWVRAALESAEGLRCTLLPAASALRYDMTRAIVLRPKSCTN